MRVVLKPGILSRTACRARGLVRHIPSGQLGRYLVVGIWNTLFGYGLFATLTWLLADRIPYAYMAASVLGSFVNITVAYLGYKFFVFQTKGNYLREYWRCFAVYGTSMVVNLALLPVLVMGAGVILTNGRYAPYLAGAMLTCGNVVFSFLGHKRFSFRA